MDLNYEPKLRIFNLQKSPIFGMNCYMTNALLDCADQITIGNNVGFAHDVMILTGYHDYTLKGKERIEAVRSKPITIKDGAWIASGAKILAGVTIGENAVIGAGSVVTKDVPDNEMWAGVPARYIKSL